jgi:hypothetical protein
MSEEPRLVRSAEDIRAEAYVFSQVYATERLANELPSAARMTATEATRKFREIFSPQEDK